MLTLPEAIQEFDRRFAAFEKSMKAAGSPVKCTDAERSFAEQDALYALGRTRPGRKVTNARGGQSPHNYGLARDYVFVLPHGKITYNGDWKLFGRMAKKHALAWGGSWLRFKDRPHCELASWRAYKHV